VAGDVCANEGSTAAAVRPAIAAAMSNGFIALHKYPIIRRVKRRFA
jgi:hypothetical protein